MKGLKTCTSENALSDLSHKPSAQMSSLVLSIFAVCSWKCSLLSFASWVPGKRCGTPEREAQQSDRASRCDGGWEKLLCCSLRCVPLRMHSHKCSWSVGRVVEGSLSEHSLMQTKAHVLDGQCSQPGRGTFFHSTRERSFLACSEDFLQILQVIFLSLPFFPLQNVSAFSQLLLSGSVVLGDLVYLSTIICLNIIHIQIVKYFIVYV